MNAKFVEWMLDGYLTGWGVKEWRENDLCWGGDFGPLQPAKIGTYAVRLVVVISCGDLVSSPHYDSSSS